MMRWPGICTWCGLAGVDLIQNCEVTGINIENGKVRGVETSRGTIRAKKIALATAGRSLRQRHGGHAPAE